MTRRARRRPKIPLRHRLPNPTAVFVGREREIAWLTAALERAPLALVRGPGGVGKTALVLRTIASAHPAQRERAIYFRVQPDEPADQVRLGLAHLLATAAAVEDSVDIAGLRGDPEELTALAIDLAEEGPFWVVVDDLHHSDAEEMRELVRQLSAYARESRWIATTRDHDDVPELEGQILDVGGMPPAALAEIAQSIDPRRSSGEVQAAVGAAAGSPWLLKQYLAAGADGLALTRAGVLESMSADARELLHTLAFLEAPFEPSVLAAIVRLPESEELAALAARGLLIRAGGGLSVHDLVRDFLFPDGADDAAMAARRARVADGLSARPEPEAALEALRLRARSGDVDAVVALLDRRGHELMALGYAPRVWALIGAETDARLSLWQLRCAAELGNATVLASVRPPRLSTGEDRLAWAATQRLLGDRDEARRLALAVAAEEEDPSVRVEARLLAARCLLGMGEASAAAAELADLPEGVSFALDAFRALLDACADAPGAASKTAALLARASAEVDPEALLDLATAFHHVAERERADEVIERVLATPRGGRAALLVSRRALLLRARIRLDRGELAEAARAIELVRPYARGPSLLRPLLIELDATRRLAVGDLVGLDAAIAHGVELAQHADAAVASRLARLERELERRRGRAAGPIDAESSWAARDERRVACALERARALLARGELLRAVDGARTAQRDAAAAGLRLLEAEASLLLADGLMAAGRAPELEAATEALSELANLLDAPRLRYHAAFYEGHDEIGVLERLAAEDRVAPTVARRARVLLGAPIALDAIDERVLSTARLAWAGRRVVTVCGVEPGEWTPAWGIDPAEGIVWLPDGRTISLAKHPTLVRLLVTLAERGGAATKEQLIHEAWGEAVYHPLRHDPKLHVSVRALRKAIEDDPSHPARLLTSEDGYAFGGAVRRVIAA